MKRFLCAALGFIFLSVGYSPAHAQQCPKNATNRAQFKDCKLQTWTIDPKVIMDMRDAGIDPPPSWRNCGAVGETKASGCVNTGGIGNVNWTGLKQPGTATASNPPGGGAAGGGGGLGGIGGIGGGGGGGGGVPQLPADPAECTTQLNTQLATCSAALTGLTALRPLNPTYFPCPVALLDCVGGRGGTVPEIIAAAAPCLAIYVTSQCGAVAGGAGAPAQQQPPQPVQ